MKVSKWLTLTATELMPLSNLAIRHSCKSSATNTTLQQAAKEVEVKLTGGGIRVILALALQAKVAEKSQRPQLKVVPSSIEQG